MANHIFVDTTDMLGLDGVVVGYQCFQFFKTLGVCTDVVFIVQPLGNNHVQHGVDQHAIGARGNGQVDIGKLRQHGNARVYHNQGKVALFARFLKAPINNRVLFGQVGTKGHQAFGVFKIFVATGRAIGTEGTLVARHRRRHAQCGIAVVIVGADTAPHQLAESVKLLGEQLPGGHHGKGIATVFFLDFLDFAGAEIERRIPVGGHKFILKAVANQRLHTAPR